MPAWQVFVSLLHLESQQEIHCRLNGVFVIITKKIIIWWKSEYVPLHVLGPQTPQLCLQQGAGC